MGFRHWGVGIMVLAMLWPALTGCGREETGRRAALDALAGEINAVFVRARAEIDALKKETRNLLAHPPEPGGLYPDARYKLSRQYELYTP